MFQACAVYVQTGSTSVLANNVCSVTTSVMALVTARTPQMRIAAPMKTLVSLTFITN